MNPDYYAILGVASTATPSEVRSAYRQRCRTCHPDRGGTHAQMLEINEAWAVLANPGSRRRYDELRTGTSTGQERENAERDRGDAQQRAQNYPRQWDDFERWLDGVTADFARAKYESVRGSFFSFPTAGESVSGWTFIIIGALLAVIVVSQAGILAKMKNPVLAYAIVAAGGAWLGRIIHEITRHTLKSVNRTPESTSSPSLPIVLACPQCSQKLRLPNVRGEVAVTCTGCRHRFSHRFATSADPPTQDVWQLRQQLAQDPHNHLLRKSYLAARTDLVQFVDNGGLRRISYLLAFGVGGAGVGAFTATNPAATNVTAVIGGIIGVVCGAIICGKDEKTRAYFNVRGELGPLPDDAPTDLEAARQQFLPPDP
ncbi:MAG: J domain-containing protein [Gemmataceae bacterium]